MCTVLPSYVKGNSSLVSTCTRCKASHIPHSQILCAVTLLRTGSYNLVLVQFHCAEIPTSSPIKSRNKSEQIKPLQHHMEEISVSTSWICQCQRLEIIFKGGLKSQPWTYRLKKKFASGVMHLLAQPGGRRLNSPMIQQWEMCSQILNNLALLSTVHKIPNVLIKNVLEAVMAVIPLWLQEGRRWKGWGNFQVVSLSKTWYF